MHTTLSSVIGRKLSVMHFLIWQNVLPVVVTLLVILISWYLWRRTSEGSSSNSGEEPTISGCEKIESPTAEQKVSKINIHALFSLFKINNTKCSLHRSLISTVCLRNVDDAVWIIDKRKKNGDSLDLPVLCSLIDMNLHGNYIDIKIVVFLLGDF